MITVKTLGKFRISEEENVLNDEILRSDMIKKLLVYMIIHREHPVTIQELSEALWYEGEIDNPAGALKNLMYRLRTIMKKNMSEVQYILTNQGAYAWNLSIEVELDIEQFEAYCKRAKEVADTKEKIQNYEYAIDIYKGSFMENTFQQHWAVTLSTYYHSMFLNAVKALAELYLEQKRYQDLEKICVEAIKIEHADEELYCYHILALIKENKFDLAMKRYEEVTKILNDMLGIRNFAKLRLVQEELLKMNKAIEAEALDIICDDMTEDEESVGVYFCGYPVFREIYRLEVRKNSRLGGVEHIVLFTLELNDTVKVENDRMRQYMIEQAMKKLKKTLGRVLRIGDVAARYSDSQFIVLLPTCTYESSLAVSKRVLQDFAESDTGKKICIRTEHEQLSDVKSAFVR